MAALSFTGVKIAGIACAIPAKQEGFEDDALRFGAENAQKIAAATGVTSRHVVENGVCTSDLCQAAAEQVLEDIGWQRDSIQALVFVSQTPDYLLPATSCCLQKRLGLAAHCATFDINLGCSGYVYGLWLAGQLVASGLQRVLLLVGDTVSRITGQDDRSTRPLFGDAGSATALMQDSAESPWHFNLGSDGTGEEHLIVRGGMFRQSFGRNQSSQEAACNLYMDGPEIFSFAMREAPPAARAVLADANWSIETVDSVVMHQANLFLLKQLAKRLSIPTEKQSISLDRYGNTSSASIPLTIVDRLADRSNSENLRLLLMGFGVGYSWGTATITLGPIPKPRIVILNSQSNQGLVAQRQPC